MAQALSFDNDKFVLLEKAEERSGFARDKGAMAFS